MKWRMLLFGDTYLGPQPTAQALREDVLELINQHEVVSCNFESPLVGKEAAPIRKIGPTMHQHPEAVDQLRSCGINVFSLANNHICDYGRGGLESTLEALQECISVGAGIGFEQAYDLRSIDVGGIKLGLLSLGEAQFGAWTDMEPVDYGYAWINHPCVNNRIESARKEVDVLLIQVHAGVEGLELPLPEWRARYRELISLGADVVVGHHPHVIQGWETWRGRPIFYSLGNFIFNNPGPGQSPEPGAAVSLEFQGGNLVNFRVLPLQQRHGIVSLCCESRMADELERLCKLLSDPYYLPEVNRQSLALWRNTYRHYYVNAVNGITSDTTWVRLAKLLLRRIFHRGSLRESEAMLLHNIRIESHRWTVERALGLVLAEQARGTQIE